MILPNAECYSNYKFYLETFIDQPNLSGNSLLHVRLSHVIKGLIYLLTYLLIYILTDKSKVS